jgi:hypothetical protein
MLDVRDRSPYVRVADEGQTRRWRPYRQRGFGGGIRRDGRGALQASIDTKHLLRRESATGERSEMRNPMCPTCRAADSYQKRGPALVSVRMTGSPASLSERTIVGNSEEPAWERVQKRLDSRFQ